MTDAKAMDEVVARPASRYGLAVALLVLAATIAFALVGARTALWYDESNYLSIAGAIKQVGLPVWFWDPDHPALFLDSPPGLLYALSLLPDTWLADPALVRSIYAVVGLALPFAALLYYLRDDERRWLVLPIAVTILCTTGFFYIELVQVRMDLPVAGLSFIGLVLVAGATSPRSSRVLLVALFAVSAAALLTKYQAACFSAAVGIWALDELLHRRRPWAVLIAHGLGVLLALMVIIGVARAFDGGGDQSIMENLQYNFGRILASSKSGGPDLVRLGGLVRTAVPVVALPSGLYLLARLVSPERTRQDPLLRLSFYLSIVVLVFNIVMYRLPGAGGYYMIQAAAPLAYISARSITILVDITWKAALATLAVVALTALTTLPLGDQSLQRWGAGLPSLISGITAPDQAKIVADTIASDLGPEEVVLLDGWRDQGRQVPYWLQRPSRYGYFTQMQPEAVDALLQRRGANQVRYIVFSGGSDFATFRRPEWVATWPLIESNFELLDQTNNPDWFIYRRKQ